MMTMFWLCLVTLLVPAMTHYDDHQCKDACKDVTVEEFLDTKSMDANGESLIVLSNSRRNHSGYINGKLLHQAYGNLNLKKGQMVSVDTCGSFSKLGYMLLTVVIKVKEDKEHNKLVSDYCQVATLGNKVERPVWILTNPAENSKLLKEVQKMADLRNSNN